MKSWFSDALPPLWGDEQLWAYNALDVCVTREVYDDLKAELPQDFFPYLMSRAMQGPALTMMRRGCRINLFERDKEIRRLTEDHAKALELFCRIAREAFDLPFAISKVPSPDQLKTIFYDAMGLPPIMVYDKVKRERRPSTNREALLKLREKYPHTNPIVELVFAIRGANKLRSTLESGIDYDGRMRCSYQVAGTMTGRWSSNDSAFGSGTNLQNITDRARRMFIPDRGKKFGQIDLAQAESKATAALSGDTAYRAACDSGDLHTYVTKLCWPDLPWGQEPDKKIAKRVYLRYGPVEFTYRDMAKRAGHGSNYGATPPTIAKVLRIPVKVAEEFQRRYFAAFPGIRRWHQQVQFALARDRTISTPLGRRCQFLGRVTDSETLKSAIAYGPQSLVGDLLNLGLYKVWQQFDLPGHLQLIAQIHDAILFQYDPALESSILPAVREALITPIDVNGYTLRIEADVAVGWNWGKVHRDDSGSVENPYGLDEWNGHDPREFVATPFSVEDQPCSVA